WAGCALRPGWGTNQRRSGRGGRRHGFRASAATRSLVVGKQLALWSAASAGGGACAFGGLAQESAVRSYVPRTFDSFDVCGNGANRRSGRQPRVSFASRLRFVDGSSSVDD